MQRFDHRHSIQLPIGSKGVTTPEGHAADTLNSADFWDKTQSTTWVQIATRCSLTSMRHCSFTFLAEATKYSRSLLGSTAAMSRTASAPKALALNSWYACTATKTMSPFIASAKLHSSSCTASCQACVAHSDTSRHHLQHVLIKLIFGIIA